MTDSNIYTAARAPLIANCVLVHGAGAPVQSEFFQRLQPALAEQGIATIAINLAYMELVRQGSRRPPPKLSLLLDELTQRLPTLLEPSSVPWFVGGKSMGGRLLSQLLAKPERFASWPQQPQGCVVFGYPYCPAAAREKGGDTLHRQIEARTEFWPRLSKPVLMLQGTRDPFGNADEIRLHIADSAVLAPIQVQDIALCNHDFVRAKSSQQDVYAELALATKTFIQQTLAAGATDVLAS